MWEEVEHLLPPPPPRELGGRPRTSDRLILDAILYVLWAGCPWRALPAEFGPWQTIYDRFAEWKRAGIFEQIHAKCLHLYDEKHGTFVGMAEWRRHLCEGAGGGKKNVVPTRQIALKRASKTTFWLMGEVFP